jgi:hypothetical protein
VHIILVSGLWLDGSSRERVVPPLELARILLGRAA